jgi:hypothetical protein
VNARKPRIEEVVSSVTARLAAAHEIRAHAARLLELAAAQEGEARACARDALGDHGERLFHAVAGAYDHDCEDASRIAEVAGLAEALLPPWQAGLRGAPADPVADTARAPVPATSVREASAPGQQASQAHPRAEAPLPVGPAPEAPAPTSAPAHPPVRPASPSGRVLYGIEVGTANAAGADRIVAQAKAFVAAGDAAQYDLHGTKWVGVHQWRRDLFRAAFAEEAGRAGLGLPDEAARELAPDGGLGETAVAPDRSGDRDGTAALGDTHRPDAHASAPWPDGGVEGAEDLAVDGEGGYADEGDDGDDGGDIVFGEDEQEPPLPVVQAALDLMEAPRPLPPFLADLEDAGDGDDDWPPVRDGPAVKVAPGLYR